MNTAKRHDDGSLFTAREERDKWYLGITERSNALMAWGYVAPAKLPTITDLSERLAMTNTGPANAGHLAMCEKWADGQPVDDDAD